MHRVFLVGPGHVDWEDLKQCLEKSRYGIREIRLNVKKNYKQNAKLILQAREFEHGVVTPAFLFFDTHPRRTFSNHILRALAKCTVSLRIIIVHATGTLSIKESYDPAPTWITLGNMETAYGFPSVRNALRNIFSASARTNCA